MGFDDPFFVSIYEELDGKRTIDQAFYLEQARNANGPILDLGCGSGRLMLPMIAAGCEVVGVDSSEEMLRRLRVALEDGTGRSQVVRSSFEDLDVHSLQNLHSGYSLIICTFNSFLHLMDQTSQIGFLTNVRSLLRDGGRFILDLVSPASHEMFLAAETDRELEHSYYDAAMGETVESWLTIRNEILLQTGSLDRDYVVTSNKGEVRNPTSSVQYRWTYPTEMRLLLMLAGFNEIEVFGDFAYGPLTFESDVQVWIAS